MNEASDRFGRLVASLSLREIRPMELHSERLGDPPPQGADIQLEWKQAYADDDPVTLGADTKVFRPKYEFFLRHGSEVFFHHTSIFVLAFSIKDTPTFDALWADEAIRKAFTGRQLQHTMWPIFRQHVLDGMSRLGLQPLPLPWLTQ
jgi:hypothetical protein